MKERIIPLLSVCIFFLIWHFAVYFEIISLPGPIDSIKSFFSLIFIKDPITRLTLIDHAFASLKLIFLGVSIAFAIGFSLGILMGWYDFLYKALNPILELLRPLPALSWLPIAIILFGKMGSVFIVFLCSFFPILINTLFGVKQVNRNLINVAKIMKATNGQIICKILIPSSFPYVMNGLRLGVGNSFLGIVAAEMIIFSSAGLGFFIMVMHQVGHTSKMMAGMIMTGVIGFLLNIILLKIKLWSENRYDRGK
jgi:ABC-type nitrate/sulfonate/bicarbonate transport system permease component